MRISHFALLILSLCLVSMVSARVDAQTLDRVDTKVALPQVLKKVDPIKEEEERNSQALRDATYECERQIEIDVAGAVPPCRRAMLASENVPVAATVLTIGYDYERAWQGYLNALIKVGSAQIDVDTLKRAIERRASIGRPDDQTSADAWATLGVVQGRLGVNDEAEAAFAKSTAMYSALIERTPNRMDVLVLSLKGLLTTHAAFRRSTGDVAGADELVSQAAALSRLLPTGTSAATLPEPPVPVTRRIGDIRVVEEEPVQLSDADVRRIQGLLPGSVIAWMEIMHLEGDRIPMELMAQVCLKVVTGTSGLRRGHCEMLGKIKPAGRGQGGGWRKVAVGDDYVLFGDVSEDKRARVMSRPNDKPLSDEALLGIQRLIARKAVATPTDRLKSAIQPWRISSIAPYQGNDVVVTLSADDGGRTQSVVVRPVGDGWDVVDIH